MKEWPAVAGERETVRELIAGASIARFGDGEFGVLKGLGQTREPEARPELTKELRRVIASPQCLIGIPTMDPRGDRYHKWEPRKQRYIQWLTPGRKYHSAFITRPDSGVGLECQEYADLLRSVWSGKWVAIVCEAGSKILADLREKGEHVAHLRCPMYRAYSYIDDYEEAILDIKPEIALLSCGVTATALANRLAGKGIQAIDIGSVGAFLRRWP